MAEKHYITRTLQETVRKAAAEFPAIVLTGPRQSGKTTLLKHLFGERYQYVSLEPPDVRAAATADPRGFLAFYKPPVIFDEIQYAPVLLPYIKELIDQDRSASGRFLLTGSQNLLMHEQVTESLAGRAAILRLLPLSCREILGQPTRVLHWDIQSFMQRYRRKPEHADWWPIFLRGSYPELWANPQRDAWLWHSSYIQTYLERDVRGLRHVGDLTEFQSFLRALAARSGQLLNLSDISRDLGIAVNTVKQWLSILEATFQVIILRPWHKNLNKRLVKTPKVYFTDTGTLCHLVGLKDPAHAMAGPMGGAIFETAVVTEIYKTMWHWGIEPRLYFWRTSQGEEVDLVIESGTQLIPIEVKLSATPRPEMGRGIESFQAEYGDIVQTGYVVHPGDTLTPLIPEVIALPFGKM